MSNDLNQCNFIGRLGQDVESRFLPNGDEVVNFSIAVGESWQDKQGEKQERTEWIRVVAFRGLAGVCSKYLSKGSKVFVSGKFKTRKWQAQDGTDRYSTEIVANDMQMLDTRSSDDSGQQNPTPQQSAPPAQNAPQQQQPQGFDDFDDSIPF